MDGLLNDLYERLYRNFGPQGWWPLSSMAGALGFDDRGYHRGDYSYPKTSAQRFEVITGAILTQNTSWRNVEKALDNLRGAGLLDLEAVLRSNSRVLEACLKPVGYFRVKAQRLRTFAEFLDRQGMDELLSMQTDDLRALLLSVNGIGEETADSILLYAAGKPSFVVDAYTRRTLSRMGVIEVDPTYGEIKELFEGSLPTDVRLYNEYHALLVIHAKTICQKVPRCDVCQLKDLCEKRF